MASLIAVAPSSGAGTLLKDPLKIAQGVRTAETIYASWISFGRRLEELKCRWTACRRCCGEDILEAECKERRSIGDAMVKEKTVYSL